MTSSRRRAAVATALLALSLTGCGAGPNAETYQIKAPADGVVASAGDIRLLNALVVVPAPGAASASPTSDGVLLVTLANGGAQNDTLGAVTAAGTTSVDYAGPRDVPSRGVLSIGPGQGRSAVTVRGLRGVAGGSVVMAFTLARAGTVDVTVPLVAASAGGPYASISPSPAPSPS